MCRSLFAEPGDARIELLARFADTGDDVELWVVFSTPYPRKPTDEFAWDCAVVDPKLEDSWAAQLGKKLAGRECISVNVGAVVRVVLAEILTIDGARKGP